jgi:glycerol-3-phosphate cytidylyltransferase
MKNKVIGYTSGVFDLFHIGHLRLLKRAKEQCDYLIVSVSTDELVQEYKNRRPIINLKDRMGIVEAIKYVDKVVPQINRNKLEAFHKYKYDIIFVGSDWKGSVLWNNLEKELNEFGAKIVFFEYTSGTSTTEVKNMIINNKF